MKIKQILNSFCLSIIMSTLVFLSISNAATISKTADLDFDGKAEKITLNYIKFDFDNKISETNVQNKLSIGKASTLEVSGGLYNTELEVIDINPNDKQKEVLVSGLMDNGLHEASLFTYKNGKIEKIGDLPTFCFPASFNNNVAKSILNKKQNQLEVCVRDYFETYFFYFRKFKIVDGKLTEVTAKEKNVTSHKLKKWEVTTKKSITAYLDENFTKKAFSTRQNEKITILTLNRDKSYFKIKNSKGELGYVPLIVEEYYVKGLKQYKDVDSFDLIKNVTVY